MRRLTGLIIVISAALGTHAYAADEYVCMDGNEKRIISVEYEFKGWQVPCKVKYEKPSEGAVEYPWNAQASPGYCEDRAEFLASKLENWGWVCEKRTTESD